MKYCLRSATHNSRVFLCPLVESLLLIGFVELLLELLDILAYQVLVLFLGYS